MKIEEEIELKEGDTISINDRAFTFKYNPDATQFGDEHESKVVEARKTFIGSAETPAPARIQIQEEMIESVSKILKNKLTLLQPAAMEDISIVKDVPVLQENIVAAQEDSLKPNAISNLPSYMKGTLSSAKKSAKSTPIKRNGVAVEGTLKKKSRLNEIIQNNTPVQITTQPQTNASQNEPISNTTQPPKFILQTPVHMNSENTPLSRKGVTFGPIVNKYCLSIN